MLSLLEKCASNEEGFCSCAFTEIIKRNRVSHGNIQHKCYRNMYKKLLQICNVWKNVKSEVYFMHLHTHIQTSHMLYIYICDKIYIYTKNYIHIYVHLSHLGYIWVFFLYSFLISHYLHLYELIQYI